MTISNDHEGSEEHFNIYIYIYIMFRTGEMPLIWLYSVVRWYRVEECIYRYRMLMSDLKRNTKRESGSSNALRCTEHVVHISKTAQDTTNGGYADMFSSSQSKASPNSEPPLQPKLIMMLRHVELNFPF